MKILLVADVSIANVIGGAERVLYEQSGRLQRRGHTVHIITRKPAADAESQVTIGGIQEWRYDLNTRNALLFLKTTLQNSRNLFESLSHREKFDCINFHQPFSAMGILNSRAAQGIRRIYTCHSLAYEEYISRNRKPVGPAGTALHAANIRVRKWLEKKALLSVDKIVVLSRFTKERLRQVYHIPEGKLSIIPGGADLERLYPATDKQTIRKNHQVPRDKTVLFTVRNLVPRMGLENLLHAFRRVTHAVKDVYLVIGGTGELQADLVRLSENLGLREHTCFAGFIPEESLPDYYRMADLFVLPTKELEGFGLVTVESLASGVPVAGTPVGGTEEILDQLDPGFLFRDPTPESMAELMLDKIHVIKNDPERWRAISRDCRQFVEDNYSWEKNVDALEKVMRA